MKCTWCGALFGHLAVNSTLGTFCSFGCSAFAARRRTKRVISRVIDAGKLPDRPAPTEKPSLRSPSGQTCATGNR